MKHGRESCFHVDDAVCMNVFNHLVCYAFQCFLALHDAKRVGKAFEIEGKTLALRPTMKPIRELIRISRRQCLVAAGSCQINDGLWTSSTVEVIVQKNLWELANEIFCECHGIPSRYTLAAC